MSTLIGTSEAVVVGSGSGPGPVAPAPPEPAVPCWDSSAPYFDTWDRGLGGLVNETGCSNPTGYPYNDVFDNPGSQTLTVNGSWDLRFLAGQNTFFEADAYTLCGPLPFDCISSTWSFPLSQVLPADLSDSDVDLAFEIDRSNGNQVICTIISASRTVTPPAGNHLILQITATGGGTTTTNFSGLLLTTAGTVVIALTPTQVSLNVAGNILAVPWTPNTALDPSTVTTQFSMDAALAPGGTLGITNGSAYSQTVGVLSITTPYGNCNLVPKC